jgi:hypothetical protein
MPYKELIAGAKMISKLILPLCLLFTALATAQSPLPRFPLPRDFVETPADLKSVSGNGALLKAIQLKFNCKKCDGAKEPGVRIGGAPVDLGTLGKGAIVTAYTDEGCDATGNCAIYVFYLKDGTFTSEQLDQGTHYTLIKSSDAIPAIATRARTGAKTEIVHRHAFTGTQFAKTGCDALYDKNDMGDVDASACK